MPGTEIAAAAMGARVCWKGDGGLDMELVTTKEHVKEAAQAIRAAKPGFAPEVALVLGSGLGGLADAIEEVTFVDYADVPHMAKSTAPGHRGRFVLGTLAGKQVICMQGRLHLYEGYTADQIGFPVYVMKELGAEVLVVTNAAGGIDASFGVGDLMLICDQVNLLGTDPCIGPDQPGLRARFFDMTHAYDLELRDAMREAASEVGVELREGVYAAEPGPSFETPAEIRAYRSWGIDAIGMSTVLEVIAARSCGMRVAGVSLISNPAAGVIDEPLDVDDVERAATIAADKLERLVTAFLARL